MPLFPISPEEGEIVPMGIEVKDWMKDTDGSLCLTASSKVSEEAQSYRRMMTEVLEAVGFVGYPTEY